MTKEAINNAGQLVRVPKDTPVSTKGGKNYLLTASEQTAYDESLANYLAGQLDREKSKKKEELSAYYNSDDVRIRAFKNKSIEVRDKALLGITLVRGRLVDNNEVTALDWYYDDGTNEQLNLGEVKQLHKFLVSEDSRLRKIKKTHTDAIDALTTVEQVQNYDVKSDIDGLSWI